MTTSGGSNIPMIGTNNDADIGIHPGVQIQVNFNTGFSQIYTIQVEILACDPTISLRPTPSTLTTTVKAGLTSYNLVLV